MIDIHCHIIPGIDDGATSMDEALAMCKIAADDGIRTIVATPHRGSNFVVNTTRHQVIEGVKVLQKELQAKNIALEIIPAHENFIYDELLADIEAGKALTINDQRKYVLLETPFESVPFYVFTVIETLKKKGIIPIIVHPERNAQIQDDMRI
ncbi:MAG: tyrosine protein phosphatase, partial [Bacteroides sp.]|nr:tyrosine protein phosphatase [Bacteroides sp.]